MIENTQRDLNIALMNELSIIFDRLGIDTLEVLQAAGTKWNFLPFRPGLVGGHCIGVDPYYLTHKAEMLGYHPEVILAGRRINDGMAAYIAQQTIKGLIRKWRYGEGGQGDRAGPDLQGKLPRPAQLQGGRPGARTAGLRLRGVCARPASPRRRKRSTNTASGCGNGSDLPADADAIVAAVAHRQYLAMPLAEITRQAEVRAACSSTSSRPTIPRPSDMPGDELWRP